MGGQLVSNLTAITFFVLGGHLLDRLGARLAVRRERRLIAQRQKARREFIANLIADQRRQMAER
ncbi:MAG: hypothetical protein ACKV2O_24285 [Acidimicrobiales bacterium]